MFGFHYALVEGIEDADFEAVALYSDTEETVEQYASGKVGITSPSTSGAHDPEELRRVQAADPAMALAGPTGDGDTIYDTRFHYGEWNEPLPPAPEVATAYTKRSCDDLAHMARMLENWDGMDVFRDSFNHYSFSAVCQFLFEYVAGFRPTFDAPKFREFYLIPVPGGSLTWAEGTYRTKYGFIKYAWKRDNGLFICTCTVPPGTSAYLALPNGERHTLREGKYKFKTASPCQGKAPQYAGPFRLIGGPDMIMEINGYPFT